MGRDTDRAVSRRPVWDRPTVGAPAAEMPVPTTGYRTASHSYPAHPERTVAPALFVGTGMSAPCGAPPPARQHTRTGEQSINCSTCAQQRHGSTGASVGWGPLRSPWAWAWRLQRRRRRTPTRPARTVPPAQRMPDRRAPPRIAGRHPPVRHERQRGTRAVRGRRANGLSASRPSPRATTPAQGFRVPPVPFDWRRRAPRHRCRNPPRHRPSPSSRVLLTRRRGLPLQA